MNPHDTGWQQHWIETYGAALDALGFDGLHLDTYGYPRCAIDVRGQLAILEQGYADFLGAVRRARPDEVISFNQVNGVPRGFVAPAIPGFRYVEVWAPNDRWRHLEGLLQRSAGRNEFQGDTLAIYPPVWEGSRSASLRTVVLSEAIVTILGANTLVWGDDSGALCHPYYVNHEKLELDEIATALDWHRFGLRCRDLFKGGGDTSWFELEDENAAVQVSWSGLTSPEPIGGALFARVIRTGDLVVVSLLDLTGSVDGSWSSPTGPGVCEAAEVSALVDSPGEWLAEVSVLGTDDGRYRTLDPDLKEHREGHALSCRVPVDQGWSVLRLRRTQEQS
jgi:dextranase